MSAFFISVLITISFVLYGVWEEKVILYGPLLVLSLLTAVIGMRSFIRKECPLRTPPGGTFLLLFCVYSLVMIPYSTLGYEAKVATLRLWCYTSVYWLAANALVRFKQRQAVWLGLIVALIFVALYSLVQHRVASNMLFGMERYADGYWQDGRLGGTYICPNHIAHLFQMWMPFCLILLLIPQISWFWKICCIYAGSLFFILIYQTQSRAGILGVVTGIGVTVLMLVLRRSRKAFYVALLVIPLACAGMLGVLWGMSARFRERMQPVVQFAEHVLSGKVAREEFKDFRLYTWQDSLSMIAEKPVKGFGPGNYGQVFPEYRVRVTAVRGQTVHPHNEYLELLAEYGLAGAVLFFGAVAVLVAKLIRFICTAEHSRHALPAAAFLGVLAGTGVHGFFDFELRIFPNAMIIVLLAGSAVVPVMQQVRGCKKGSWVSRIALVMFVVGTLWSVQVVSSAWLSARAFIALDKGSLQKAQNMFNLAAGIDPQNWKAHLGQGQVFYTLRYNELDSVQKRSLAEQERDAYVRAFRYNVKKEEIVYGLGRAELFLGNRERGLDLLRQAADYKRFNDFYWRKLGIELRKAGLYKEALERFEYAWQMDRTNRTVQRNIQWLKAVMGGK